MIDSRRQYRGRFAPSPTGPLHFGSLVAAIGSYLQAKANHGLWLVRMEDIDPPREQPGAADDILRTLEAFGLHWDESVLFQSTRIDCYRDTLSDLTSSGHCYPCSCSRREIHKRNLSANIDNQSIYPGTCRSGPRYPERPLAMRIRVPDEAIVFRDFLQGERRENLQQTTGDFVLRRGDGLYAYQLAVVVDDEAQKITEVVRGIDLLDSTVRQIFLQQMLNYHEPAYMHLPIAVNSAGDKLSKRTGACGLDASDPSLITMEALDFLGHRPPAGSRGSAPAELLDWAIGHWRPGRLSGVKDKLWDDSKVLAAPQ